MPQIKMVRRQLYVPVTLNKELKELSRRARVSESEIVRRALIMYLEQEKRRNTPPEKNPVLKAIGIFAGEASPFTASERHDEIIYGPGYPEANQ
ncbi:ribbon-helix-helix domain-containing protein [Neomoorella carbonis]|uniref:ribbon-helix-helix domain-containing protein n=1 Tax=Neomoorella carbonis TaxID=3062783 RepID=UPI001A037E7E|nr:ribbon-helix-helix domain-containing protein [Moorella humiferrea]